MKILKMSADWCVPCSQLTNILTSMKLDYTEVDIDKEPELVAKYNIRSVPVLIYLQDDLEIGRLVGLKQEREIHNWLSECETTVELTLNMVSGV